ncbi:MAG: ATP-binding cassette domain-containing protein [Pseudonocardiaceae bacterium]
MATLKAFNASRRRGAELHARAEAFCQDSIRVMVVWCLSAGVAELAIPIGTAAAVGIGALHRADGIITTVELFTILLLSRECFRPLHDLQTAYHQSYNSLPSSREILALLDTEPEPAAPAPVASIAHPPGLRFEDISFGYAERSERALDGFSLSVAPGERVALVGRSGAGKTTIVSLLLRFFELEQRRVLIGERGLKLSGGERQRIAIARALLKNAPILIMDEAVSNLDAASEREVAAAMARAREGRTTLVIAHRLSTIQTADRIVVLHDGHVAETGTHRELLAAQGSYVSLLASQLDTDPTQTRRGEAIPDRDR